MSAAWPIKRLGDLSDLITKGTTPTSVGHAFIADGINFVKVESISENGQFIEGKLAHITKECHDVLRRSQLKSGDILFSIAGALGRTAFVTEDIVPANTNQALAIIRLNKSDEVLPAFVLKALETGIVLEQIEKFKGGVAQQNLSLAQVQGFTIPIPPLPEQQRIVGILDKAFDGIATAKANAEKNLQNARALFESHLQSVFTQRGEGWVDKPLGEICQRVSVGHVGPTSKFYCDPTDGVPFLRSQNVRPGKLNWEGVQYITREFHERLKKSQLRIGDLLFVRVGANRGDCCAVQEVVAELNCANIVFARPTQGNAAYLERYCQSPPGREQLLGMTTGSAQGVINTSSVAELVVPLPPPSEQKMIVAKVDALAAEAQHLESIYQKKLAVLDNLKKSLLHQAFSGAL